MEVAERNRKIKKVLSRVYSNKNIRVKGGRGTSYGWVYVRVFVKKQHRCDRPNNYCKECEAEKQSHKNKIMKILSNEHLLEEIGVYYDDFNVKHREILLSVELL